MKTYKLIPIVLFSLITSIVFSQKVVKIDEKTRHYFEIPTSVEKTDYAVHFKNIVSKFDYIKFAVLLENKTSDYLIWNNANNKVIITDGDKDASKIKIYKVRPYKTINRTFDARGGNQLLVNDFKFVINGVSRVPSKGNVQKIEDFKLPQSKNKIESGNFSIVLTKSKKKTDETAVYFEATYNGDDFAILTLNEISVRVNDNDVFANDNRKDTPYLLTKGDNLKIKCLFHIPARVVDMQFADMYIQFNNAFVESKAIPLSGSEVVFQLDEELTKEKN
ncbi:MAG: hypothetical protein ACI8ZX_000943 [Planctomycetota bacterium]|jgi:hypothetical protein